MYVFETQNTVFRICISTHLESVLNKSDSASITKFDLIVLQFSLSTYANNFCVMLTFLCCRLFKNARTETIRPVSDHSVQFTKVR